MYSLFLASLGLCALCCPPAIGSALFTDLGPSGNVYSTTNGLLVEGAGPTGVSWTRANLFTVAGTGSLPVTGIDLAVGHALDTLGTFYASIWTDNGGLPGAEVANAYWSLSTSTLEGTCCTLVSITGITGVTLTGGQQYFMILGPLSTADDSNTPWIANNQGTTGLDLYSNNGGSTWTSNGIGNLGAFDVTSTPEPTTWPILLGLAGLGLWRGFRMRSAA